MDPSTVIILSRAVRYIILIPLMGWGTLIQIFLNFRRTVYYNLRSIMIYAIVQLLFCFVDVGIFALMNHVSIYFGLLLFLPLLRFELSTVASLSASGAIYYGGLLELAKHEPWAPIGFALYDTAVTLVIMEIAVAW